jgi:hypothetical protein
LHRSAPKYPSSSKRAKIEADRPSIANEVWAEGGLVDFGGDSRSLQGAQTESEPMIGWRPQNVHHR